MILDRYTDMELIEELSRRMQLRNIRTYCDKLGGSCKYMGENGCTAVVCERVDIKNDNK